ncbi:hypothetical protein EON64_16720 [archaeon]|nr:MAG: hypothetical protein EON64_16720 [archaeon]
MELLINILLGVFFLSALISQFSLFLVRYWRKNGTLETKVTSDFERYEAIEHAIDVLSIAFLWYSISLSFTLFNKWFMQEWAGGFHFPMFITSMHMSMKLLVSRLWACTPGLAPIPPISWRNFLLVVFPIGALTAGDIVLSNTAILFLPLSLVTAIKGSSLVFVFVWGVLLGLEEFDWSLLGAVVCIALGLGVAVSNSLEVWFVCMCCSVCVFVCVYVCICGGAYVCVHMFCTSLIALASPPGAPPWHPLCPLRRSRGGTALGPHAQTREGGPRIQRGDGVPVPLRT